MAIASIKAVGASAKRNSIPKSSVKTQSASATVDVELLKKQLIESSLKDAKQLSRGFAKGED